MPQGEISTVEADSPTTQPTNNRLVIAILLIAGFVVILNETTMNVALSSIMADFGVEERTAQWLTTGFMLTMALVIPITGWLIDRLKTRQLFVFALSLFSTGTLICAISQSFPMLLAGRVVQASGTAMVLPLLMTTVMQLVSANRRGAIMGNISMVISVAPAVGPTLSGFLLGFGSWRFIFATMFPIALLMLTAGIIKLRNVGEHRKTPLDLLSVLLSVVGFGPLVYGLSLIGETDGPGWHAPVAIAIGVAGLALFVWRQTKLQREDRALLDLRTFTFPQFVVGATMLGMAMMALFGTIILVPLLCQRAFGLEPLQVGLMMLPGGILMGILGPIVGRLFDRVGPRTLVTPASFVALGAFLSFASLSATTPWWLIMLTHMVMSMSFAFVFTPLFTVALGALPRNLYSHGSATISTIQQIGGAAGTAVFVTMFSIGADRAAAAGASEAVAMVTGSHRAFLGQLSCGVSR